MPTAHEPLKYPTPELMETRSSRSNLAPQPDKAYIQSPTPSFAESFSTALSSPADDSEGIARFGLSTYTSPHSLRKSTSVDSFAQLRDNSRSHPTETPAPKENASHPQPVPSTRQLHRGRHRGESLGSAESRRDPATPADSDVDRYDPLNAAGSDRFRRISLHSSKASIKGGDLPLPSRARNNSIAVTPISEEHGSRRGSLPSVSSTSSLQSSTKKMNGRVDSTTSRMRSGSLSFNPTRPTVGTGVKPPSEDEPSSSGDVIVLAVVGTKGCGKSTLIRKGLASYGPSGAIDFYQEATSRLFSSQKCSIILGSPEDPLQPVEIIEVQVQSDDRGLLRWPQGLRPPDGVMICYDATRSESFQPVRSLLHAYRSQSIPTIVMQCKSELRHEIESDTASSTSERYDTGLIEVSHSTQQGKEKMKQSFQWMFKAILRQRAGDPSLEHRNPATPDLTYQNPPWADNKIDTLSSPHVIPQAISTTMDIDTHDAVLKDGDNNDEPLDFSTESQQSTWSTPPTSENLPPNNESLLIEDTPITTVTEVEDTQHVDTIENPSGLTDDYMPTISHEKKYGAKKELRSAQWVDLDALLDKLLFLAVSGEDPTFITHFLLTYRRFSAPRSVLLAMQKRMRQLDTPCGDPMFASFAQMRICHLLEMWIRDYAYDFAVPGTAGALNALIKSIIAKTHLLHYGSEILPFLEQLPSLVDRDSAWALKVEITETDTDSGGEDDENETRIHKLPPSVETDSADHDSPDMPNDAPPPTDRKSSISQSKALHPLYPTSLNAIPHDYSPKQHIKDLFKLAQDVLNTDSEEIAQEITRKGVKQFLAIEPRDWLQFTFITGKKANPDPIADFNAMSNHLADWVVSLILCHERPRQRARQIEKFVDIAQKLRQLNNYSALRAFVAGINIATDDPTMEVFKAKAPDAAKNLMSWDVLLQQIRSHRAYRLALRNSKGACIPALEVHMSDLIRAHEGNPESNPDYPGKIHWGKFNMMGRFITSTLQCQAQCRNSHDYDFPKRESIAELFSRKPVMSIEMQKSRLKSQDFDYDEGHPTIPPGQSSNIPGPMKKLFFW